LRYFRRLTKRREGASVMRRTTGEDDLLRSSVNLALQGTSLKRYIITGEIKRRSIRAGQRGRKLVEEAPQGGKNNHDHSKPGRFPLI